MDSKGFTTLALHTCVALVGSAILMTAVGYYWFIPKVQSKEVHQLVSNHQPKKTDGSVNGVLDSHIRP